MTNEEKEENPLFKTLGGYLKFFEYQEAFKDSWNSTDEVDRKKVFNLPNFCPVKFKEISGIDVNEDTDRENKRKEILKQIEVLRLQAEEL